MSTEPNSPEDIVHDGLHRAVPVPRDSPETAAAADAVPDIEAASVDPAAGSGESSSGTTDSAGGIMYAPEAGGGAGSGGSDDVDDRGEAVGLNKASGPAAERDSETADNRGLTTDISPSD
jgi:hypothetical protein